MSLNCLQIFPIRKNLFSKTFNYNVKRKNFKENKFQSVKSVQLLSRVWLCDPMNCSTPGLPVYHQLLEFTQTHIRRVSDAIQPSHFLSSPSPPAPNPSQHQSLFQWVNSSHEVARASMFFQPNCVDSLFWRWLTSWCQDYANANRIQHYSRPSLAPTARGSLESCYPILTSWLIACVTLSHLEPHAFRSHWSSSTSVWHLLSPC